MTKRNNAGVYQKSNGFLGISFFTIVVDGQQISRKKVRTNLETNSKPKVKLSGQEKPQFSRLGQIENVKGKLNGKR